MTIYSDFTIDEELKPFLIGRGLLIPSYNFFEDPDAIRVIRESRVTDNFLPVEEIKIVINKESYMRHVTVWQPIFVDHYERLSWSRELAINHLHSFTTQKIMKRSAEILMEDMINEETRIRKSLER